MSSACSPAACWWSRFPAWRAPSPPTTTNCSLSGRSAEVFALGRTSLRHVEVVARLLNGEAARRLAPEQWAEVSSPARPTPTPRPSCTSGARHWSSCWIRTQGMGARGDELSNPSPEPCDRLACSYPGRAHSPVNLRTSAGTAPPVRRVLGHDRYLARYRQLRTANPAARAAPRCSTPTGSSAWPPGSPLRPHGARRSRPPRGPSRPIPPCRGPAAAHTRWPSRS